MRRGRRSRFSNQTKTAQIRVPENLRDHALEFAELLDSIGGRDDLQIQYRLINRNDQRTIKEVEYVGVSGGYISPVETAAETPPDLAIATSSDPLAPPDDEWDDEDEWDDDEELEVEEFKAIALTAIAGYGDEWIEEEEDALDYDADDEDEDEDDEDAPGYDADEIDVRELIYLEEDEDLDEDEWIEEEEEEALGYDADEPEESEESEYLDDPEWEEPHPFHSSSAGGSFKLAPTTFSFEELDANLRMVQAAQQKLEKEIEMAAASQLLTQAQVSKAAEVAERVLREATAAFQPIEVEAQEAEPNLAEPGPTAKTEEFAQEVFKHWRALVIGRGNKDYWGQKADLGDIYDSGFKSTAGVVFLCQIGAMQGVELPGGCQIQLHIEGRSSYKIGGKEYGSISFGFPSQQSAIAADDSLPATQSVQQRPDEMGENTAPSSAIPRLETKNRRTQEDPLIQKLLKLLFAPIGCSKLQ